MSKERWVKIFERKLSEAEERCIRRAEDWAAEEATAELMEQMADECDQAYDWDRDERLMGNRP